MPGQRAWLRGGPGPKRGRRRAACLSALVAASVTLLLSPSCGRRGAEEPPPQPIGSVSSFLTLLDGAMRRADPQGAVLVVLWSTEQPPPAPLERIAKDWSRYGLIPIGVCLDLADPALRQGAASQGVGASSTGPVEANQEDGGRLREAAIARVRAWERSHKKGIRGIILDGEAGGILGKLGLTRRGASIALLSAQGAVLWSREGFGGLNELDAMLEVCLGEPPLASAGWPSPAGRLTGDFVPSPRLSARRPAAAEG